MRIRQRLEQNGIHGAENCRVGANSQRQCQYGHGSESGRPAQCARAVAHVLKQRFQPAPALLIARHLPDDARVAKFPPCRLFRVTWIFAALFALARSHSQMTLDLLAEFFLPSPPRKNPTNPCNEFASPRISNDLIFFAKLLPSTLNSDLPTIHSAAPPWDPRASPAALGCSRPEARQ